MNGVPLDKCGAVAADLWDSRGSFVCKKEPGHDGHHQGRRSVRWIDVPKAKGGAE